MLDFQNIYQGFAQALMEVLPLSPFRQYIVQLQDATWIHWLNWIVPINTILTIFSAWLGAVAVFYLYSLVMRWLKVIA